MQEKNTLWLTVLALSLSLALAVSAFAQGLSEVSKSQSPSSPAPSGGTSMKSSEHPGKAQSGTSMQSYEQAGKAMLDKAATEADRSLNQRIRQALSKDTTLATDIGKIHLDTNNGEVTLHGSAATEKVKADIATKVQQVAGVKKVDNQLQMAPN
jgi:osmotically-inducible protein OsmY